MKKFLAILMTLCLLCSAFAFAEESSTTTINNDSETKTANTTVSYTVEAKQNYTVTIPASLSLTQQNDNTLSNTMTLSLNVGDFNVANKKIIVKLTAASFMLSANNNTTTIPYNIFKPGSVGVQLNTIVLEWSYGTSTSKNLSEKLTITTAPVQSANVPAGDYTDTLTFTVAVTDNTTDTPNVSIND